MGLCEGLPCIVVYKLRRHEAVGAVYRKARALGCSRDLSAYARVATLALILFSDSKFCHTLYSLLALLAADNLVLVRNALAEIWLRTLHVADLGCELPHCLLVGTGDGDDVLLCGCGEAFRNGKCYGVREADIKGEVLAPKFDLVSDSL